jgi:CMP-N-acetylneuraminic acid synthetase
VRIEHDDHGARLVPYVEDAVTEPRARQRHATAYFRANIVASRIETIRDTGTLTGERVAAHIVGQDRAVDIDSEHDLLVADLLLRHGR